MKNKQSFFLGLITGIVALICINSAINGFSLLYGRMTSQSLVPERKIDEIFSILDEHSINEYKKDRLIENMYRGLVLGVGDPYTYYYDKKALQNLLQQTEGVYAGIGVVIRYDAEDGLVTVDVPYEGSPGALAGILPGDKIIKVNGLDMMGADLEEVSNLTRGEPGTTVDLTVYRPKTNETLDMKLTRAKVSIPTVDAKIVDGDIGYIRISSFERVTLDQFKKAYDGLMAQRVKGLVIDLRNNPGGLMDVVTKISDMLVPSGVIVYTEDKNGNKEYNYSDDTKIQIPLTVLVNENSASASEILAGAVKDYGVGKLVGTKTFGKGIVQNLYPLSDGTAVKVTIAKYYTPKGICIHGEGIIPEFVVELPEELQETIFDIPEDKDTQLHKAIEVIREW